MRFLLELVPCCGSPTPAWRKDTGSDSCHPHESKDDEDVRSLVPPPPLPLHLRKRTRTVAWSPSLGSISEDRAFVAAQRKVDASTGSLREGTGRMSEGEGGGGSSVSGQARAPNRDRRRRDSDEQDTGRSYSSAMMITTFSPTPFVF